MQKARFMIMIIGMLGVGTAFGQDYPTKPIHLVGSLPGGGSDLVMRLISPAMSASMGQPVVVDNRPGTLLGEIGSKSAPDGYTVLVVGTSFMIGHLLRETTWDPVRDFSPVTLADAGPNVLIVHPSLPAKSVKELIALAKARSGELNYATGPAGSSLHLGAELFKEMAGVNMVWVPYKSQGMAVSSLIGGETQVIFAESAAAAPHVQSGRVRALAVTSGQPSALWPGLPTVSASGVPGYELLGTDAVVVPAKTPAPIINRLNQEIVRALNQPSAKETLFKTSVVVVAGTPDELGKFMNSEITKWGKVIKEARIKVE